MREQPIGLVRPILKSFHEAYPDVVLDSTLDDEVVDFVAGRFDAAPYVAAGQLVRLLEPWSAAFPGFYLCFPARRQMAPPLRAFIDTISARIGMQPGAAPANLNE